MVFSSCCCHVYVTAAAGSSSWIFFLVITRLEGMVDPSVGSSGGDDAGGEEDLPAAAARRPGHLRRGRLLGHVGGGRHGGGGGGAALPLLLLLELVAHDGVVPALHAAEGALAAVHEDVLPVQRPPAHVAARQELRHAERGRPPGGRRATAAAQAGGAPPAAPELRHLQPRRATRDGHPRHRQRGGGLRARALLGLQRREDPEPDAPDGVAVAPPAGRRAVQRARRRRQQAVGLPLRDL